MIGRQTTRARDLDAEPDGGAVFTGRRDDRWRQRLTGLLLAFLWLIPVFVTALAGWWAWRVDVAEARDHADVMARLVAERVEHAIDTQAMVLDWVLDRTRGMSWEDIEASPAVHVLLQDLDHRYDASAEIFMIDGEGRLRGDSVAFPLTGERAIDPGPLETVSLQDAAVLIGRPAGGPVSGVFSFPLLRARAETDSAGFAGISIRIKYLGEFFRTATEGAGGIAGLHARAGGLLVQYPAAGPLLAVPANLWSPAGNGQPLRLASDDTRYSLGSAVAVGRYPLAVSFWIDTTALFEAWLEEFFTYGAVALASILALGVAALIARRGARREALALAGWQNETQQRLLAELATARLRKFEALGVMSGGIAHYFNNLLPALRGHLEIASGEARAGRPDEGRLRRMSGAIDEAREFLRGILTYSGRNVAAFDAVNLSAVVSGAVETLAPLAGEATRIVLSAEPDLKVYGQASQLGDLVRNILKNAMEAMEPEGGVIELSLVRRTAADGGEQAVLECRDNGRGMTADTVERAFDPFFTTRPESGNGLGLAICDGVVRGHGGEIVLESRPGAGTLVRIALPLMSGD